MRPENGLWPINAAGNVGGEIMVIPRGNLSNG